MYVLCVGMYRSCSTWQYQIACHLVQEAYGGRPLGFIGQPQAFAVLEQRDSADWAVLKCHDANEPMGAWLERGLARGLYAFRDLRDVVFSLMHKMALSFDQVVHHKRLIRTCLDNDAFWRSKPGVLCQRYEELIVDPEAGVRQIARHLGMELDQVAAADVAARYSLAENRQRADHLAERLQAEGLNLEDPAHALVHDRQTLLHWNHIREGRIGGWRAIATPSQRLALARECSAWLIARGYERDLAWLEFAAPECGARDAA